MTIKNVAAVARMCEMLSREAPAWGWTGIEEMIEELRLATEDPFAARSYDVLPRGASRCPAFAEANPDALRLWVLPMRRGQRYGAVVPWRPPADLAAPLPAAGDGRGGTIREERS